MKKKSRVHFLSFVLCIVLLISYCTPVFASNILGVTEEVFDGWTDVEKANWFDVNFERLQWSTNGFIHAPSASEGLHAKFLLQADVAKAGTETYEEWIARNCDVVTDESGEPQLLISDELSDAMYLACMKYINEEAGWYNLQSYNASTLVDLFTSQTAYNNVLDLVKSKSDNQLCIIRQSILMGTRYFDIYVFDYDGLVYTSNNSSLNSQGIYNVYSPSSWANFDYSNFVLDEENDCYVTDNAKFYRFKVDGTKISYKCSNVPEFFMHNGNQKKYILSGYLEWSIVDTSCKTYRVYKSMDEYKAYSVGQRPYYMTDKFQDYDVNGDNSCIISESDLQNGSVYGDVYNYIINNYGDSADSLTEDELMRIVSELLAQNSGNSGSSSGGSSGGGLGNFLTGLGSIGDALLSILGKLLEYVSKAFELITGLIDDVLTIVPESITKLLTALFPFIPEEWVMCVTLSLVLGVVGIIISLFKK